MTYNPLLGRWMEEDPLGFEAGDVNLYRYVGNDPTSAVDPSGTIGLFFDGNQMTLKDNTIITQLQMAYANAGSTPPVFRYARLGFANSNALYTVAPGTETPSEELARTVRLGVAAAVAAHERGEPVDLFGYSRGAVAAILVAFMLNLRKKPIPVRFMGLIEPSDTWSGWETAGKSARDFFKIPPNVNIVWVGIATGKGSTKPHKILNYFPTHFEPIQKDRRKTGISINRYPNLGHLEAGKDPKLGKDLWEYAKLYGVPLGNTCPIK